MLTDGNANWCFGKEYGGNYGMAVSPILGDLIQLRIKLCLGALVGDVSGDYISFCKKLPVFVSFVNHDKHKRKSAIICWS